MRCYQVYAEREPRAYARGCEAEVAVQAGCLLVGEVRLEQDRRYAAARAFGRGVVDRGGPEAGSAMGGADEQFVDEAVPAAVFEAESEGEHDVAGSCARGFDGEEAARARGSLMSRRAARREVSMSNGELSFP